MKISVIVPVYNAERYLEKCIKSVIAQTYTEWELLLVDDGSKDGSADIIRMYELKDERIRGIRQENGGAGKARNTGIQNAKGDYVVFLDSDDYLDPEYFFLLQQKAGDSDIIFIDALQIDASGKLLKNERVSRYKNEGKEFFQRAMMTGKAPWGGWRKAVRLNLLKEHDIQFSTLNIGEEALYSFRLFEVAEKIDFIDEKPVYMYVNHDGSLSKLTVDDPWGGAVREIKKYLMKDIIQYEKFADTMNAFNAAATIVSIDRITQMYHGKDRKEKIKKRMNEYKELRETSHGTDRKSLIYEVRVLLPFLNYGMTAPVVLCSKLRKSIGWQSLKRKHI